MSPHEAAQLLELARAAIRREVAGVPPPSRGRNLPPALNRPAAAFVTLRRDGVLRGCIGSLEARGPLAEVAARAAVDAAFHDPRFPPVAVDEVSSLEIEISVLSALEEIAFAEERQLLAQLDRGVHGLLIEQDACRATFLPAVWESVPEPALFLAALKRKAGLSVHDPLANARAWRYTAECIGHESAARTPQPHIR